MTYKFILFGHNEHEIDKARELSKKLNMRMEFSQNNTPSYSPVKNAKLVKEKTGFDPLENKNLYIAKDYQKDHTHWFFCKQLWHAPQINWDGKILGCCANFDGDFGGNVFKDGLLNALNHPKMIYAKNMLAYNAKPIKSIPCTNCFHLATLKKMNLAIIPDKRNTDILF